MTLATSIRIVEPTPVRPIFDQTRTLLGAGKATFRHVRAGDTPWPSSNNTYHNDPGQGLPALLWVEYGPDGPLREYMDEDGKDCSDWYECQPPNHRHPPKASIEVMFDTAYGYKRDGANCNDLHAWLVLEMGRWLDAHSLTWYWQNEYTGEWHRGYEALAEFGNIELGRLKH